MSDQLEYDDLEQYPGGTQILWGRVLVLLLALALAFWLGTTFGGDAGAQARLADQREQILDLEAQVASLEAQLAAVSDGSPPSSEAPAAAETEVAAAAPETEAVAAAPASTEQPTEAGGREYVVQAGDSLASIAQEVYGDPTLWREIADANDLNDPSDLTIGEVLRIPERP